MKKKNNPGKGKNIIDDWKTEDSIFQFILKNIGIDGKFNQNADKLPDEKIIEEDEVQSFKNLKFAPGLTDALYGASDSESSERMATELSELAKIISQNGDVKSEYKFYQMITKNERTSGVIDIFLNRIIDFNIQIEPHLIRFAKDLAFKTSNRNSVKYGIAMLGKCQDKNVINDITKIGLHDEFTLFSTVAILQLSEDTENDLLELAKKLEGWGKIEIVERLASIATSQNVKDWLILDGYKNDIMDEYLAYTCASNGGLNEKLSQENISSEQFKSAGDILEALTGDDGPGGIQIYRYESASVSVENYIRHAFEHAHEIKDFLTLNQIKVFLLGIQNDFSGYELNGWTNDIISNCIIDIINIAGRKEWVEKTLHALKSTNDYIFYNAENAALILRLDIWDIIWKRLNERIKKNNNNDQLWWYVYRHAKEKNLDEIINLVLENIPLKVLTEGPKDDWEIESIYGDLSSLDFLITFLENYIGKGEQIILLGLNSPVISHRYSALRTLYKWGKNNWSDVIIPALDKLKSIEPDKELKQYLTDIVNGIDPEINRNEYYDNLLNGE